MPKKSSSTIHVEFTTEKVAENNGIVKKKHEEMEKTRREK